MTRALLGWHIAKTIPIRVLLWAVTSSLQPGVRELGLDVVWARTTVTCSLWSMFYCLFRLPHILFGFYWDPSKQIICWDPSLRFEWLSERKVHCIPAISWLLAPDGMLIMTSSWHHDIMTPWHRDPGDTGAGVTPSVLLTRVNEEKGTSQH